MKRTMVKKTTFLLLTVSQIFAIAFHTHLEQFEISKFQSDCSSNVLSLMSFRFNSKCVQMVRDNVKHSIDCTATIAQHSDDITFYMRSMTWLLNRNILIDESLQNANENNSTKSCENFLVFLDSTSAIPATITAVSIDSETTKILFPFSKLYFILEDKSSTLNQSELDELSVFFHGEAIFGYIFEFHSVTKKMGLRDLLTKRYITEHSQSQVNVIHPFLDRRDKNKRFRARLSDCYPYVIILNATEESFSGIEYQLMRQVTSNWNVSYFFPDIDHRKRREINYLGNKLVDIEMCSVWLTELDYYESDVSAFHNHECYTLLTPKPVKLSEVTAIYKTFSAQIWIAFGICLFATSLLLWAIARTGATTTTVYSSLSRSFLDVIHIATSHGVGSFPKQQSINILLVSWILLCLWIGICYTTIYTSRLTSPGFTKIIDSIEDFLEADMLYGVRRLYKVAEESLSSSSNPAYQQLQKRCRVFKDRNDIETSIKSGKYAVFGAISNDKYFTSIDWLNETTLFRNFRFMKKTCIFNHYSVFAFKKFSPYTELFSDHALRFQEFGFSEYWYEAIYFDKRQFGSFFEDYPKESKEPKQLTIKSILGALLILAVCVGLSTVVFIFELIF